MNSRAHTILALVCLNLTVAACGGGQSQPVTKIDYAQRLHDESLAAQRELMGDKPNQWTEFEALMTELQAFTDEAKKADREAWDREEDDNTWAGMGIMTITTIPNRGTPAPHAAERDRVLAIFMDFQARGIFELTARAPTLTVTMPPAEDITFTIGQARFVGVPTSVMRFQSARMHLAGDNDAQRIAILHEVLALGRNLSWQGSIFDWILGQLHAIIGSKDFLRSQLLHPTASDAVLARADALIELEAMHRTATIEYAIRTVDMSIKDVIQDTYFNRGQLDLEAYENHVPTGLFGALAPEEPYEERGAVEAWFDTLHQLFLEAAIATGPEVLRAHDSVVAHRETATVHSPLAKNIAIPPSMLFEQQRFDIHMAGARVILAIERYRLRHDGTPPETIDDLGDLLPKDLRTDPLTGTPWMYEPTATTIAENGDTLLEGAVAWPYTLRSAPLPGVEPSTRWDENPKGGVLITVPIQGPRYDEADEGN